VYRSPRETCIQQSISTRCRLSASMPFRHTAAPDLSRHDGPLLDSASLRMVPGMHEPWCVGGARTRNDSMRKSALNVPYAHTRARLLACSLLGLLPGSARAAGPGALQAAGPSATAAAAAARRPHGGRTAAARPALSLGPASGRHILLPGARAENRPALALTPIRAARLLRGGRNVQAGARPGQRCPPLRAPRYAGPMRPALPPDPPPAYPWAAHRPHCRPTRAHRRPERRHPSARLRQAVRRQVTRWPAPPSAVAPASRAVLQRRAGLPRCPARNPLSAVRVRRSEGARTGAAPSTTWPQEGAANGGARGSTSAHVLIRCARLLTAWLACAEARRIRSRGAPA